MTAAENENDAIEEAGRWYCDVLEAVRIALLGTASVGRLEHAAASFVASLARQSFTIEREASGDE